MAAPLVGRGRSVLKWRCTAFSITISATPVARSAAGRSGAPRRGQRRDAWIDAGGIVEDDTWIHECDANRHPPH